MITRRVNENKATRGRGSAAVAAALWGSLFSLPAALAQDSGTTTVNLAGCLELESEAARRACIDAQVDEFLEERGPADSEPSRAIEDTETDRYRRTDDTLSSGREPEAEKDEYFGTILELSERLPSSYIITLDNGQVWEQTEPKRYPLRPGLEVRIYPTRWGSRYRLTGVDSGGHIQVRRLR